LNYTEAKQTVDPIGEEFFNILLERIDLPEKNWKLSASDVSERALWKKYIRAYEDCFNHTSTDWAPWYIIPADDKAFMRVAVAATIVHTLLQFEP